MSLAGLIWFWVRPTPCLVEGAKNVLNGMNRSDNVSLWMYWAQVLDADIQQSAGVKGTDRL
jgi:hypothetical protein